MKTVCLKVSVFFAKTNILFDIAITVKVICSVMQRGTRLFIQQDLIAITGLYLCIDHQQSWGQLLWNVMQYITITFKIIAWYYNYPVFENVMNYITITSPK